MHETNITGGLLYSLKLKPIFFPNYLRDFGTQFPLILKGIWTFKSQRQLCKFWLKAYALMLNPKEIQICGISLQKSGSDFVKQNRTWGIWFLVFLNVREFAHYWPARHRCDCAFSSLWSFMKCAEISVKLNMSLWGSRKCVVAHTVAKKQLGWLSRDHFQLVWISVIDFTDLCLPEDLERVCVCACVRACMHVLHLKL